MNPTHPADEPELVPPADPIQPLPVEEMHADEPAAVPEQKAQVDDEPNIVAQLSVVGIGASAGGLAALQAFFDAMPPDTGMTFVVVTHLPAEHESVLGALLQTHTPMLVQQVMGRTLMEPDHVYVIPPGKRMLVDDGHLVLEEFAREPGKRLQIDIFLRSLGEHHRDCAAIILSGSGSDGAVGIQSVKQQGGLILVQDPEEAEFDSMPRSAIATGLVDIIAPVAMLAQQLVTTKHVETQIELPTDADQLSSAAHQTFAQILAQLRLRTGHDFSGYKPATMLRRIARRMQLGHTLSLTSYLQRLRTDAEEAELLYRDLLIHVTEFFRDVETWNAVAGQVIPRLFEGKGPDDDLRVWTVGCATGEESYGIAILLLEHAAKLEEPPNVQVFASDLGRVALEYARAGVYPQAIESTVTPERLNRFFIQEDSHYRVRPELRKRVLFAPHNLLQDPPFSKLDLVICRNLLIYLRRPAQLRVFETFHYALRPNGYLFLGTAETAEGVTDLFDAVDKRHRIYRRVSLSHGRIVLPVLTTPRLASSPLAKVEPEAGGVPAVADQHRLLLEEMIGPPSLLVDQGFNVLHLSESVGRYMQPPAGQPTVEATRLVRPELRAELRLVLQRAFAEQHSVRSRPIPVQFNGEPRPITIEVRPSPTAGRALVLFLEEEEYFVVIETPETPLLEESLEAPDRPNARELQLEAALLYAARRQQTLQEDYEATVEELRSANEELQSTLEEHRSTAEELETSKEELQSINEELLTVNQELKSKVEEISATHNDLQNLFAATEIATLFLDRELRIRRYTPRATALFNLIPSDRGRPIANLQANINYPNLEADARRVLDELKTIEREVQSRDGAWHLLAVRPYMTLDHRINGIILTLVDITANKQAEQAQRRSQERLELALEAAQTSIFETDLTTNTMLRSLRHDQIFGYTELLPAWSPATTRTHVLPEYLEHYDAAVEAGMRSGRYDVEAPIRWPDGSIHWFRDVGRVFYDEQGKPVRLMGVTMDTTESRQAGEALRVSEARLRLALNAGRMCAWEWDAATRSLWASGSAAEILGRAPRDLADVFTGALGPSRDARRAEIEAMLQERPGDYRAEFQVLLPGADEPRWLETRAMAEDAGQGRVRRVLGVTTDITQRKQAEVAAAESEERFAQALAAGRMAAWEWDVAANRFWFSGRLENFDSDMNTESLVGLQDLVHPDDWPLAETTLRQAIATRSNVRTQLRLVHPTEGTTHWVEVRGSARLDMDGHVLGLAGLVTDITEWRESEEAQRIADERLRLVMEAVTDFAIVALDDKGVISAWSVGAGQMFGYSAAEAVGRPLALLFTPEDRAQNAPEREMEQARRMGSAPDERWHLHKDGSRLYVSGLLLSVQTDSESDAIAGYVKVLRTIPQRAPRTPGP